MKTVKEMTNKQLTELLNGNTGIERACEEARAWLGKRSAAVAWRECERGSWLLWISARVGIERQMLVLAACKCARVALKDVLAGEERPRLAIEAAEGWARGKVTREKVRNARQAAYKARDDAYAAAASSSAVYAAGAAGAAADTAYAAGAARAETAAFYAAAAAARAALFGDRTMEQQCGNAVRSVLTLDMLLAALTGKEHTPTL